MKEPNKHAPLKKKFLRHYNNPLMAKNLRKRIMVRSKLRNNYNKNKYKRQRNLCLNLLRKTKKNFYKALDEKQVSDSKTFWKNLKPFFSDKGLNSSKITLVEQNAVVVDEEKIANIMNNYFINIAKNLNLKPLDKNKFDIDIFENHISIKKIYETFPNIIPENFHFKAVSKDDVRKEIGNLNIKKLSTYGSIPASILKQCVDVYLPYLTDSVNYSQRENTFPEELKHSEVIPVYKKLDPLKKENYRPVSLLPHVSKVLERIIYQQINTFMKDKLSKCLTGFRKSHEAQDLLVTMLEKWKKAVDKGEHVSALFMDLSKAFDTVNHDLLLAKLKAYGFSLNTVELMRSYLKNRKQRVQINNKFSSENIVIARNPQGSID